MRALIAIFVIVIANVNSVLSSEFQSADNWNIGSKIASTQNYYPNDTLNLVTLGIVNGKKYLFASDLWASWYEASYFCNAHGMDLASIETLHENNLIMDHIANMGLTAKPLWISGHKIGRTAWLWINGDFILFTDWGSGEPSAPYTDHCINIVNSKWNDEECQYIVSGFICEEREVVKETKRNDNRSLYPDDLLNMVTLDPATGKKYLFANASASWFEASYFCNAYGMDLVTIETQKENDLIINHIESLGMTQLKEYWTSAHNIGRSTWFWIKGDNIIFSDWASGQPDDPDNEHCMNIYNGNWYNYHCFLYDASAAFICESRELPPDNSTNSSKYYPADMMNLVNLGPGNGKNYLFLIEYPSWFEASYFCNAHGMDLVSIETQEENDAIVNHLAGSSNYYWTSGHKISRATYLWINGEYMLYTDWAPGEPDNYSFNCMTLYLDDWYDLNCYYGRYFICEERTMSD